MSDVNRRGAIYLHRSDMESLKTGKTKPGGNGGEVTPVTKANSSGVLRGATGSSGILNRKSKSTTPPNVPGRRGSIGPSGRRGSMLEGTGYLRRSSVAHDHPGGGSRRGSILESGMYSRRGSSFPEETMYGGNRRGSRLDDNASTPQRRKKKAPEPEPALTKEQVEAFQEVFDLFDSNGGGTIDADELQSALSSVDIHLPCQDIRDVLEEIDKDGSGEIDFEEFLTLMTNTEKFLETFAASHDDHTPDEDTEAAGGRETVLFDALTKFMKTSALKQMDVLERYFNTKYKRAQAPHVVMHYAAGARLIGLTEKQLVQHLDRLQASNEGYDYQSPYAEPLRIMLAPKKRKLRKKKKCKPEEEVVAAIPEVRPRLTGKIRIRVHFREEDNPPPVLEDKHVEECINQVVEENRKEEPVPGVPRLGWVRPTVKSVTDRLPKMKITYTMDDLATIRQKIQVATDDYQHDLAISKRQGYKRYWKTLKCHRMNTTQRAGFKKVFHAYSDLAKLVVV